MSQKENAQNKRLHSEIFLKKCYRRISVSCPGEASAKLCLLPQMHLML